MLRTLTSALYFFPVPAQVVSVTLLEGGGKKFKIKNTALLKISFFGNFDERDNGDVGDDENKGDDIFRN